MRKHYDLAVVGLGIMGSSTLYAAARRGLSVIGLEQSPELPHASGSSHGQTRVIRQAYFEHPDYVPLIQRAYRAWHELEQESGTRVLFQTGGLMMGSPSSAAVSGAIEAAERHHLPYEVWDSATVSARFPAFHLPESEVAVYEEAAGYLLAEGAWSSFLSVARARGAVVQLGSRVTEWDTSADRIRLNANGSVIEADRLVITAGPWIRHLWPSLPVWVERQTPFWLDDAYVAALGDYPIYLHEDPEGQHVYGFPYRAGEGLKIARHHGGVRCTTETVSREVTAKDEEALRAGLGFFPAAKAASVAQSSVCLYTNTPDEHFVVGQLPGSHGRIVVGAGFSGHGFKFASIMGDLLVQQAFTDMPLQELALFSPERLHL
ncbi:N-methyl-L-tryptophan oxidase [Sulfobacillus harzensis]|uniref:N-methyl-L-tryptophan oxidase n=1 Tax=Sulfobacillus harzensis TaxID=2729629 RepID=A0A7Y0L6U9_9FIRM|nr:N-methyl-L-tryptophan oxidase [Sulfobacillus harzensis]NMP24372.1 N-methyl-L-tryptophan oxidase [Sulfobacillus harzensis]